MKNITPRTNDTLESASPEQSSSSQNERDFQKIAKHLTNENTPEEMKKTRRALFQGIYGTCTQIFTE